MLVKKKAAALLLRKASPEGNGGEKTGRWPSSLFQAREGTNVPGPLTFTNAFPNLESQHKTSFRKPSAMFWLSHATFSKLLPGIFPYPTLETPFAVSSFRGFHRQHCTHLCSHASPQSGPSTCLINTCQILIG